MHESLYHGTSLSFSYSHKLDNSKSTVHYTDPMPGGTTPIIIISATIGGIAVFTIIFLIVLLTVIICFVHAKGMEK